MRNFKFKLSSGEAGFTFLEMILVVLLLAILVSIAALSYGDLKEDMTRDLVKVDLNTLKAAVKSYYMKNRSLPADLDVLVNNNLLTGPLPDDKFVDGSNLKYLYNLSGNTVTIWSRGPDRIENHSSGNDGDDIVFSFGP